MTLAVGDKIPSVTLTHMTDEGPAGVETDDLFAGKKVVLFGVPGAFTPTCSAQHLPGFVTKAAELKAKGVDTIACISVNDVFVMGAWGKDQNVGTDVLMLADGSADFVKAAGLELDLMSRGLGLRNQRFALIAEDGVIKHMAIDEAGVFEATSADAILGAL